MPSETEDTLDKVKTDVPVESGSEIPKLVLVDKLDEANQRIKDGNATSADVDLVNAFQAGANAANETAPNAFVRPDLTGLTERQITRLGDVIADREMDGKDTSALKEKLQGYVDLQEYIHKRDYQDQDGNVHDALDDRIKPLEEANQKPEDLGEKYEDMPLGRLIGKWAEAEDNHDRTTSINIQDTLQEYLLKNTSLSEEHKSNLIDVMHNRMMSMRHNLGEGESQPTKSADINDDVEKLQPNQLVADGDVEQFPQNSQETDRFAYEPNDSENDVAEAEKSQSIPLADDGDVEQFPQNSQETDRFKYEPNDSENDVINAEGEQQSTQSVDETEKVAPKEDGIDYSKNIKLVMVDMAHEIEIKSRQAAESRLDRELGEGGRFKRFVKGIWKGNLAKDYYLLQYKRQAKSQIELTGDIHLFDGSTKDKHDNALEATIEKWMDDSGIPIHTEAGETREVQKGDSEIAISTKDLIRRYCKDELTDETLIEERTRMLNEFYGANGKEKSSNGIRTVDNMLEIARAVKGAIEHGESIDNVLNNMQIITGESRSGVRTEAKYNAIEKFIDKVSNTKLGSMISPELLATAVTITASVLKMGSQSVVGALTKTILPGAASGLWAGIKEWKRIGDERVQKQRDKAEGNINNSNDKRANEMGKTIVDMMSAVDATETLRSVCNNETLDKGGPAAIQDALAKLTAIQTRIKYSDSHHLDLISFSNPIDVEQERMALDYACAEAKINLESRLTNDVRHELGLEESVSLTEIIKSQSEACLEVIQDDINAKDRIFRNIRAKHVAKAVAIAVATGIFIGLLGQEVGALSPTRAGLLDLLHGTNATPVDGVEHQTILHGLFTGEHNTIIHTGPNADYVSQNVGSNGEISISSESTIVNNGNDTFSIIDHNNHIVAENIAMNQDGSLPPDSIDQLTKLGMIVNDKSFNTEIVTNNTEQVSLNDFMQHNLDKTTNVIRDFRYDNGTPDIHEFNELGLDWGENNGITDTGYQMSVAPMTPEGSFTGDQTVNYLDAIKNHTLKLAISVTGDTQNQVLLIDISPDSKIDIPFGSTASHFFSKVGEDVVFNGKYAEIVQITGVDGSDVTHIAPLATVVGIGSPAPIFENVVEKTIEHHPAFEIITPGYDTVQVQETFTETAPFISINSRRSMEPAYPKYEGYHYRGNEYLSPKEQIHRKEETSPRLLEDPNADLVASEEYDFYKDLLVKNRGSDYVASIEKIVADSPELNNVSSNLKAIVTIPVNASGKSESENIYNVLTKAYGLQDPETLKNTMILLHVNWFDTYGKDEATMRANIARTKDEIQRAKNDLPQLQIASFETEWKRSDMQSGVIGHVSRKLNDVALMALQSATASGRMEKDQDVLLIRNDADVIGIRKNYLKRYVDEFTENKEPDIFMGMTSFDQTKAVQAPGLVLAGNFMQSFDIIANSREGGVHTGGANFGVRASALAAVGSIGFDEVTGAGSDDSRVGQRINQVRRGNLSDQGINNSYGSQGYQYRQLQNGEKPKRKVGMPVVGARLDTDSGRGQKNYQAGKPFAQQWFSGDGGFSDNGYTPRERGVKGRYREPLFFNPEAVIRHISSDFEATINTMYASNAVTRSVLAFTFPSSNCYELSGKIPACKFRITPEGSKFLRKKLASYGQKKREWYGANGHRSSMIKIA